MGNTNNGEDQEYKQYLDERRLLIEGESVVATRFDTSILTLSGGALILSMTFIKELTNNMPMQKCSLITAWIIYGLTITLMLISLLTSQKAYSRQRDILDENLYNKKKNISCNFWRCITYWLNCICILGFIVATFLLGYFIIVNL